MNKEIKEKWIKALRSGEYRQGKDALKKDNKYCCLGVLCDLYGKEHDANWQSESTLGPESSECFLGEDAVLPGPVIKWAELDRASPLIEYDFEKVGITELNDFHCCFNELAALIEKQL